jgi:predicted hydrolase (HD superfamily)
LHDLDYLKHPHTVKVGEEQVHPMPLARFLLRHDVPPLFCAAVMEHAGYIGAGTEFSSKLSAALSACDDLATYAAAIAPDEWHSRGELSVEALDLLAQVRPMHFRLDMDSACPTRVLAHPNRFINRALAAAA